MTIDSSICVVCGQSETSKALYYGFPVRVCVDENCGGVEGFWSGILRYHFDGYFITYDGWYLGAIRYWLFGK